MFCVTEKLFILKRAFSSIGCNNIRCFMCKSANYTDVSSNIESKVRVRFGPSPTGYLHLGGLRTALYNYLFAKSNDGTFVLRIEDTDQTRLVEGAADEILKDLEWCGITPDETPNDTGTYGPYVQSERLHIYRQEVEKLLKNGSAYYCFCTERRLDLLRKEAVKLRQIPKYDNSCRFLTAGQIAEKLDSRLPYCIRFKLDSSIVTLHDLVYGTVKYDITDSEGDPIIIKSDGFPTYHFANVVDDHFMEITHVLRGVEWQISTTKHLMMFKALDWTPPFYGHLPLIMNTDGSKLSKRQSNVNIGYYKHIGIFPNALINYIVQMGGGFKHTDQAIKPRIYSLNELIKSFDLKQLNCSSGRVNLELLDTYNRLEFYNQIHDSSKCSQLIDIITRAFKEGHSKDLAINRDHIKKCLQFAAPRFTSIQDLIEGKLSFLWHIPGSIASEGLSTDITELLIKELEVEEFKKTKLQYVLKNFATRNKLNFNTVMKSLRIRLSGLENGPGVAEMMEVLGKDETIYRIRINHHHN